MAQATFTVPATDTYVDAVTGGRYHWHEGDVIPLDLAIRLQMPGAEAPAAASPFSPDQDTWLADLTAGSEEDVVAQIPTSRNDLSSAVAVTATADGLTTGIVPDGADFVTVTSGDAAHVVTLPAPTPKTVIALRNGATGYQLRSSDPETVAINGGTGEAAGSAIGANVLTVCVCGTATTWLCSDTATDGTTAPTEVAAP
jgi:hypothetical protein